VQAEGFETALRAYVGACVDRGGCFLGGSVDADTRRIRALLDQVERQPMDAGERSLHAGNAVLGVWAPLYNESFWPTLDSLHRRLEQDWARVDVVGRSEDHPDGPSATIVCREPVDVSGGPGT